MRQQVELTSPWYFTTGKRLGACWAANKHGANSCTSRLRPRSLLVGHRLQIDSGRDGEVACNDTRQNVLKTVAEQNAARAILVNLSLVWPTTRRNDGFANKL